MSQRISALLACLLLAGLVLPAAVAASAAGDPARDLLAWSKAQPEPDEDAPPSEVERRRVRVDASALAEGSELLGLELFSGRHLSRLRSLERRDRGEVTWFGDLDGSPGVRVVLTLTGGLVAGTVFADDGIHELRPEASGAGDALLIRIDDSHLPACGGAVAEPSNGPSAAGLPVWSPESVAALPRANGTPQVDVLVFYTFAAGTESVVQARIRNAMDVANAVLVNSQVDLRFRLLDMLFTPYNEVGLIREDMYWLASDPEVAALRAQYQADLVAVITAPRRDQCGFGQIRSSPVPASAFLAHSATAVDCLSNMTLAHELGHNLGLDHDPENAALPPREFYPWSYGHFVNGLFRTVMSYSTSCVGGCPRVPYFSNPNLTYEGQPLGIPDQRDSHRTLNLNAGIVAGFDGGTGDGGGGGGGGSRPAAPADLAAEVAEEGIRLRWTDRANNEQGFRVFRAPPGALRELLATLAPDSESYLDTDVRPASTYTYTVAAFNDRGERSSEALVVDVPPLTPLTAELRLAPGAQPRAGEVGHFSLRVGGASASEVHSVRWSFPPGGLAFSPEPCGDGLYCAGHLFAEAGTHAVTARVEASFGRRVEASITIQVPGPDADFTTRRSLVQSVIFGPRGDTGTFRSHCWSHNLSDAPVLIELAYLPRGVTSTDPAHRQITLLPGQTLFLDNVLASVFDEQGSVGALRLSYQRSSRFPAGEPEARTFCRSFVELADGTSFGQLVAEDREETWSAAPRLLPGILHGDGFTASLQAANLDDRPGQVEVELLDAAGAAVGPPASFQLGRGTVRLRTLVQLFPQVAEHSGPFTARFSSSGIRYTASATLLENTSEDQIFVPARLPAAGDTLVIPRVTTAPGQFDAFLVSWLVAYNPSSKPTTLDFELWQRGQANLDPLKARRMVQPGEAITITDLVGGLFALNPGVGALQVHWTNADAVAPRVLSYALNQNGPQAPRFGMLVDSQPVTAAGQRSVGFGAEQSDRFRSSYGAVNLSTGPTRLQVTLRRADGTLLAETELSLRPRQHLERTLEGIFQETPLGEGSVWTVETTVTSGGPVVTYLAHINASGDVFFVPDAVVAEP